MEKNYNAILRKKNYNAIKGKKLHSVIVKKKLISSKQTEYPSNTIFIIELGSVVCEKSLTKIFIS